MDPETLIKQLEDAVAASQSAARAQVGALNQQLAAAQADAEAARKNALTPDQVARLQKLIASLTPPPPAS